MCIDDGNKDLQLFSKINEKLHIDFRSGLNALMPLKSTIFCQSQLITEATRLEKELKAQISRIELNKSIKDSMKAIDSVKKESSQQIRNLNTISRDKQKVHNAVIFDSLIDPKNIQHKLRTEIIDNSLYVETKYKTQLLLCTGEN